MTSNRTPNAPGPVALVWCYRDLRLQDNPALAYAATREYAVIPAFIWAPEEEAPWPPGAASRWWLHQSLSAFAAQLERLGSPLVLRCGPSLQALEKLVDETGASAVFWNRRYEPALTARDTAIKTRLQQRGLTVKTFNSQLLLEPWETKTNQGKPYTVFTPFWKNRLAAEKPAACLPAPAQLIPAPARLASLSVAGLNLEPKLPWKDGLAAHWRPGTAAAQQSLAALLDAKLGDYAEARDRPAVDGTSALSPYLHFGELSPRQIWHAVTTRSEHKTAAGAESFLRELGWREFAYHLLYHFPETTLRPLRTDYEAFPWRKAPAEARRWQQGMTGFPLVDAGMRQLWASGWMHNRVRMVVASFLSKNLRISWLSGAQWFWDTLVDADLANNTLGWQWSAGCGADAAPFFRIFNPVSQSQRFDPDGSYLRLWIPELHSLSAAQIHTPWTNHSACGDYPEPMLDLAASRNAALAAYREMSLEAANRR